MVIARGDVGSAQDLRLYPVVRGGERLGAMPFANAVVATMLQSPLRGLLAGSTDLLRYTGRRSGRTITMPTQYARDGDALIILVGRWATKTWWRNFQTEQPVEVLVRGVWMPMTARAIIGSKDPSTLGPLLDRYLERFPRAAKTIEGGSVEEHRRNAVIVWCRPR